MNILLTSVGRRAYMVKYFQAVLGSDGQVHVCNSDDLTVAFTYADKSFISPLIYDPAYIPTLLDYCKGNHIDILIPLFDIDLLVLARHKSEFAEVGTTVIVSSPQFIEICNDKWKTFQFLRKNGFYTPRTYNRIQDVTIALHEKEIGFPIVVKPRFGCGSIATEIAHDESELQYLYTKVRNAIKNSYLKYESSACDHEIIFQEFLKGQEHGVDVINDMNGNFVNAIVKRKLAMRAGETDIAETIECKEIFQVAEKISRFSKHIGNLDMDVFLVEGTPYVLEMNARFGGGYPFSHAAGCNLPYAIVKWCKNETIDPHVLDAKNDVRAFKELIITKNR